MNRKKSISVLVVLSLVFVLSVPLTSNSDDLPLHIKSLKGIKVVDVIIEDFAGNNKPPFTKEFLQNIVELKLRLAGIQIDYSSLGPYILVTLNPIYLDTNKHFVYSLRLSVNQPVFLARNNVFSVGTTWVTSMVGIMPERNFRSDVKDTLETQMDKFLNDYLKANPR